MEKALHVPRAAIAAAIALLLSSCGKVVPLGTLADSDHATDGSSSGVAAPRWFRDAPDGVWVMVAAGEAETIRSVLPDPIPHVDGASDNPGSITAAWTGGGVDQARGELLLVANGGGADYPGNEAYGISLREERPRWRRLTDPTPNSALETGPAEALGAFNADGRPRAMQSTFECFGDGRMWFVYQNVYTSNGGNSTSACFSFDRGFPGLPDPGGVPLAWTADNLGPWEIHPNPNASWTNTFGKAAWDRVRHKVWGLGGNNNVNSPEYWSVDTAGASLGASRLFRYEGRLDNFNSWVVVAHDLRLLIAGGSFDQKIFTLAVDRAGEPGDWQAVSNVSGTGFFQAGAGGAYVMANHAIGIADPKTTGSNVFKLVIPTTTEEGRTVYDPSGEWTWTSLSPEGVTLVTPGEGSKDVNSKWGMVEDLGNGRSALVVVTDIDGPVYAYKVPKDGL